MCHVKKNLLSRTEFEERAKDLEVKIRKEYEERGEEERKNVEKFYRYGSNQEAVIYKTANILQSDKNCRFCSILYFFKGIVSRDFVVCFLVSFDRSDISTHQERVWA
jgi:hypothetical protein